MSLRRFIVNLGCAIPFIGSYFIIPRSTFTFDFYDHYFIFILIHLYNIFTRQDNTSILPSWLIRGFSVLLLSTLFATYSNPGAFNFAFSKQFIGAIFSASSYFLIFKLANFNVFLLFTKYLKFAFIISLYVLVEEILHVNGIHITPAYSGIFGLTRVSGLSGEPYNLSLSLFPAVFFYLSNYISTIKQTHESTKRARLRSSIIFLAFFFTFSSTGYIGLFLAFIIIAIHKGYFNVRKARVLLAPFFFGGVYLIFAYLASSNKNFNTKLNDGIWFLQGEEKKTNELNRLSSSSFALLSNYYVSMEGFKENPIAGVGLGNYEVLYNKKFPAIFGTRFESKYGRSNFNDGNSMFLRLLAETGVIGISLFLFFIISFLIKSSYKSNPVKFYLVIINNGIFILFLIRLIRCGNYLSDGMFFFIFLFYYSYMNFQRLDGSIKTPESQKIQAY